MILIDAVELKYSFLIRKYGETIQIYEDAQ